MPRIGNIENLLFLYTVLKSFDYSKIDFELVGEANNLSPQAARMRLSRLCAAMDKAELAAKSSEKKTTDSPNKRKRATSDADDEATPVKKRAKAAPKNKKALVATSSSKVLESPASPGPDSPPEHEPNVELSPTSLSGHMDTIGEHAEPHLYDEEY